MGSAAVPRPMAEAVSHGHRPGLCLWPSAASGIRALRSVLWGDVWRACTLLVLKPQPREDAARHDAGWTPLPCRACVPTNGAPPSQPTGMIRSGDLHSLPPSAAEEATPALTVKTETIQWCGCFGKQCGSSSGGQTAGIGPVTPPLAHTQEKRKRVPATSRQRCLQSPKSTPPSVPRLTSREARRGPSTQDVLLGRDEEGGADGAARSDPGHAAPGEGSRTPRPQRGSMCVKRPELQIHRNRKQRSVCRGLAGTGALGRL